MKNHTLSNTGLALVLWMMFSGCLADTTVTVGSKKFTESVILGELATQLVRSVGTRAIHRRELGGSRVLWNALLTGEIDIYPEYTGTLYHEIFAQQVTEESELRRLLAAREIEMSRPLGFNNSYALGMKEKVAQKLNIHKISDLLQHPELVLGFSNEFMARADGWPGLRAHYGLPQRQVSGLDHDLAYRGLEQGSVQVIDLYSTDAEIQYYGLRVLEDDRHYFPDYKALFLYRSELLKQAPEAVVALRTLEGHLDSVTMVALNAQAKLERIPDSQVAGNFLEQTLGYHPQSTPVTVWQRFYRHTKEHLALVSVSLLSAIIVAIPLGVIAAYRPHLGQIILSIAGIIQTIPSLALLVFMIPLLGIGGPPAMVALFLYSLLPILRNTYTGLRDIPPQLLESGAALGLSVAARLRLVELPMASRAILAGIKTSAVINVGTATLGALIGAGGYGQPILSGIRLDDVGLILEGAIPAAGLALLVQGLFEGVDRVVVPKGLRLAEEKR
ncbi:glycine betaine ABC transporter substrate-binding protein [Nitrosococcus wardiae]|uniref:ABC transporter permease subunit n=1 Tax=Nitrosococcus wardiae TaxID=1814290 RepID=A0A4P7BXD1_9GAMM|nr:glycine betaine ABC transporter substrate-binding protein [Nitrosococcus wardiae]QBQ54808.1 ABC transporter permease subunit [Nitrosococcus wardiae]